MQKWVLFAHFYSFLLIFNSSTMFGWLVGLSTLEELTILAFPHRKIATLFPRLLPIPFPYLRRTCAVHASYLSRTCVGESRLFYVKYRKHGFCRRIYGLHTAKVRLRYGLRTTHVAIDGRITCRIPLPNPNIHES